MVRGDLSDPICATIQLVTIHRSSIRNYQIDALDTPKNHFSVAGFDCVAFAGLGENSVYFVFLASSALNFAQRAFVGFEILALAAADIVRLPPPVCEEPLKQ